MCIICQLSTTIEIGNRAIIEHQRSSTLVAIIGREFQPVVTILKDQFGQARAATEGISIDVLHRRTDLQFCQRRTTTKTSVAKTDGTAMNSLHLAPILDFLKSRTLSKCSSADDLDTGARKVQALQGRTFCESIAGNRCQVLCGEGNALQMRVTLKGITLNPHHLSSLNNTRDLIDLLGIFITIRTDMNFCSHAFRYLSGANTLTVFITLGINIFVVFTWLDQRTRLTCRIFSVQTSKDKAISLNIVMGVANVVCPSNTCRQHPQCQRHH